MGTVGVLGSVTSTFTADVDELVDGAKAAGQQLEKMGDQAVEAGEKVKASGDQIDATARRQEAAIERARQAFQRELVAQDQRIAKEKEVARAKELSALKADILSRSTVVMAEAIESSIPKTAAASGALRVLEGNVTNNIRAAERFITTIPGMSTALNAAFPIIGAIALLGVLSELGERLTEFVRKNLDAGARITEAMEGIRQSTMRAAHELELENAKLDEQIGKLERKPQNGLAVALAQARVEADKLTQSLDEAFDAQQKALKENGIGFLGGQLTSQAPTSAATEMAKANREAVRKINAEFNQQLEGATPSTDIGAIDKKRLEALRKELTRQRDAAAAMWNQLSKESQTSTSGPTGLPDPFTIPGFQTANMSAYGNMAHLAEDELRKLNDGIENSVKKAQVGVLEGAKTANAELQHYLAVLHELMAEQDRLENQQKQLQGESFKIQAEIFQDMETPLKIPDQGPFTQMIVARLEAEKQLAAMGVENARAQELWNISMAEATGQITKQQAAIMRQSIAVEKLNQQLAEQTDNHAQALAHPELWTKSYNPEMFGAQMAQTQGQLGVAQSQLNFMQQQDTLRASVTNMFTEWIQKATDLRGQMREFWDSTTNSLNDALIKLMTDPRQDRMHLWRNTGKQIFTGIARTGLDQAEGGLMGMIPGLKGLAHGKLGTQGNPMWVKSADVAQQGLSSALGSTVSGAAGASAGLGGFLSTALSVGLPFLADGGPFAGGSMAIVGERGPEIAHFGSSGYMHSNASIRQALSSPSGGGSGGGDTHHHWNIDARGATDPAAVHAAINKAIAAAAPHIVAGSIAAQKDMNARRPAQPSGM